MEKAQEILDNYLVGNHEIAKQLVKSLPLAERAEVAEEIKNSLRNERENDPENPYLFCDNVFKSIGL